MLGNLIGGFIVILVGEHSAHSLSNHSMHNPEYRLTSSSLIKLEGGQDRSDSHNLLALTTDKGFQSGRIYSLNSCNNMKHEINIFDKFASNSSTASRNSTS